MLWVGAPRWLYTPVYLGLGWVAVFYLGDILDAGGAAVVALLAVGGLLYSVGGVVYAIKRPNPSPRWFGFHEVFHALTLGAFAVHYIAVSLTTYGYCADAASQSADPLGLAVGALGPHPLDLLHRRAQLAQPLVGVPADQAHRPGQRLGPRPGDAGADQGVEHLPLGLAQPGHDRHGEVGEEHPLARRPDAPGDLAVEPVLGLAGDRDPLLAGALAELPGPAVGRRGPLGVAGAVGRPRGAARVPTTVISSRSTESTSTGAGEPVLGQPAGEPAADRAGQLAAVGPAGVVPVRAGSRAGRAVRGDVLVSCNDDYPITSLAPGLFTLGGPLERDVVSAAVHARARSVTAVAPSAAASSLASVVGASQTKCRQT